MTKRVPPVHARLFWVATHGGAGASTLADLAGGTPAVTRIWPTPPPTWKVQLRVVLVARSHLPGLTAAQHAITEWAAGLVPDVDLLGLVVVADAPGRLPRPLREMVELLAGGVPQLWQLPWSEDARLGQLNGLDSAPRAYRDLLADLLRQVPDLTVPPAASTTENRTT